MILQADSGFIGIIIWIIIGVAALVSSTQKKQKNLNWTRGGSFKDSAADTGSLEISTPDYTGQPSESLTNLNPRPQRSIDPSADYHPFSHSRHLQSTLQGNQQGQMQLHKQSQLSQQLKHQMEVKQAQQFEQIQEQYHKQIQNGQNQIPSPPSNPNQQDELKTELSSTIPSSKMPLNLKLTLNDIMFWQILGPCPGIQYKNRHISFQ